MSVRELVVVGGGPAGLATAITAALQGVSVQVLERGTYPLDKACGEGVLPAGLAVLGRLGVLPLIDPSALEPIVGIRYVQEDGSRAEARLPGSGGFGIRRTALSAALHRRAVELGIAIHERTRVERVQEREENVLLETAAGSLEARFVVAADGLASPIRKGLRLDVPLEEGRRFGLRQHYRVAPWSDHVEVHLAEGIEAYVTPTGRDRIGLAFLFERGLEAKPRMERLLRRFPVLLERLEHASVDSEPRGAGPMLRPVRRPVEGRVALVGDAAGYVDALTGEGLSLALVCAESLGRCLPGALARQSGALQPFLRTHRREFRTYSAFTHSVLAIARRPALRRKVVRLLAAAPFLFAGALGWMTRPR